jgi:hypothetical protein
MCRLTRKKNKTSPTPRTKTENSTVKEKEKDCKLNASSAAPARQRRSLYLLRVVSRGCAEKGEEKTAILGAQIACPTPKKRKRIPQKAQLAARTV